MGFIKFLAGKLWFGMEVSVFKTQTGQTKKKAGTYRVGFINTMARQKGVGTRFLVFKGFKADKIEGVGTLDMVFKSTVAHSKLIKIKNGQYPNEFHVIHGPFKFVRLNLVKHAFTVQDIL